MPEPKTLCTFWLDDLLLGIDVHAVQEVLRCQTPRRVPLAADSIRGLLNLRGQVITAIDMRVCLNLPSRPPDQAGVNIIVRSTPEPVSLLVDTIGEIVEVDLAACEPPPQTLRRISSELLVGMYRLQQRLLIELDYERVIKRGLTKRKERHGANEKNPLAAG